VSYLWGPFVYAVAADTPGQAIELAWAYALANEGARDIRDWPVAPHRDDMRPCHRERGTIYRTRIALVSARPVRYANSAEAWL
jgi:hypothetical protein